jgi:hypothetical protein
MNDTNKAYMTAKQAADIYGSAPQYAIDNEHSAGCWIAWETDQSAVVVYIDEPDCTVSTGNYIGRFAKIGD